MIYKIKITFTTNFLGGGDRDKKTSVRSLKKTDDGLVEFHDQEFKKTTELVLKQLNINLNVEKLKIPNGFNASGRISVLRRVYNKVNIDLFEGIKRGNSVTMQLLYNDTSDKSPSADVIKKIMSVFGKFHGISQWGRKFNCGRFVVNYAKILNSENYEC